MLLLVFDNVILNRFRFDLGLGLVLFHRGFGKVFFGRVCDFC